MRRLLIALAFGLLTTPAIAFQVCTQDCSGHEAGYQWALDNGIDDASSCSTPSDSFNEGCEAYVEEQAQSRRQELIDDGECDENDDDCGQ